MSASLKKLEDEVKLLSASDRATLVQIILESLHADDADVAGAWADEISRRAEAFDCGDLASYPAEDVFAEARRVAR